MRPGQQNRRGRGRNGRKSGGQNPLSRNFESNGPDVKIRGNASHIAEKYMALARDAMSSGDQVMAENYLQHAEHYNRIIMAAQAQYQEQMGQRRGEFGAEAGDQGQGEGGGFEGEDEGYDEHPFGGDSQPRAEFRQNDVPRGYEPQPGMPLRQDHNEHRPHRGEGRPYEGRSGGEGRFGGDNQGQGGGRFNNEGQGRGQGEGRHQQGEFRGRRNRHRHDNNRFRQSQGGGMPANPADIAAMAAANGNGAGFQDNDRRRDRSEDRSGGQQEPGQEE